MSRAVSERSLIGRLNRALAREDEVVIVRKTRGDRWRGELGDFYAVDTRNVITNRHVNPERWARDLGVLREDEVVS